MRYNADGNLKQQVSRLNQKELGEENHMKVTVCIGSSCHLKGSRQVVERLQKLIEAHQLQNKVELGGTFCMAKCQQGVCVTVDEEFHSVTPQSVDEFFKTAILPRV